MNVVLLIAAQSLLGGDAGASPYDPPKRPPYKKRDHIQILVVERSKAQTSAELRTDRRSRWEVELDKWVRFDTPSTGGTPRLRSADLTDDPGIDLDARYRRDNTGRTSRNFDLTFTVTAEIMDVRPNGNLVIQAKKTRKINSDEETILLTGEVSPNAVLNNTVKSESIANLRIDYSGKGPASDQSKPGFLGKLLDLFWPF